MTIYKEIRSGAVLLRPEGELNADQPTGLPAAVDGCLAADQRLILIDLGEVPYINSSGIGELVKCAAQVNLQKGLLALVNLTPFVNGVLEATRLNTFFTIHATADEALAAMQP